MSRIFGPGNRNPVQQPQNVRNQPQPRSGPCVVISSVQWNSREAAVGNPVGFTITLAKMPVVKMAHIDVVFVSPQGNVSERLPVAPIKGGIIAGVWQAKALGGNDPSSGAFKLQVRVDHDTAASAELYLSEHAAARVVRMNNTDRFG